MDSTRKPPLDRLTIPFRFFRPALAVALLVVPSLVSAQVRTKKPDRGVYRPPTLTKVAVEDVSNAESKRAVKEIAELVRDSEPIEAPKRKLRELVEVPLEGIDEEPLETADSGPRIPEPIRQDDQDAVRTVGHEQVMDAYPDDSSVFLEEPILQSGNTWTEDAVIWDDGHAIHDGTCEGCPSCTGCDTIGCDSIGCCGTSSYRKFSNSSICFNCDRWFGSVELLLMFRRGDQLPPLVTTTVDANPDPDTAGQLDDTDTRVLYGNTAVLKDMTAGGRFTLGTWIDNQQCRSLVLRGWFAGEETTGFHANQNQFDVLARPVLNVTDNEPVAPDALLVAFPDRASGSLDITGSSDVFGGDVSIRQFVYGQYGGSVDVLYGYQYMRLNERLRISSVSTSLVDDDPLRPLGQVFSAVDSFKTQNEFHGGQVGLASRYREKCWSFHALGKVACGSLSRRAKRAGATFVSVDNESSIDPNGLLVRSTNAGAVTDHTFGWIPELDLSIGWQKFPCFDVTFGYHILAMTDALQVSGAIDPDLAVNTADPPEDQQRPAEALRYRTFYVQGIHFGLQYVY